jgi:hypothetical protein
MGSWKAERNRRSIGGHMLNPVDLVDKIGKCKSHALSRIPSDCRTSPRDKASVPFGITGIPIEAGLPQRAFQEVPADILGQAARLLPRPSLQVCFEPPELWLAT